MSLISDETIVALITPIGEAGVGVIRLSGLSSLSIGAKISRLDPSSILSHGVKLASFYDSKANLIDEGLFLYMKAPRSFTGEDVIEFHCHGNMLIARKLIETCLFLGARMAQPGEFSYRAFTNGRIDMAQAEAIQQLIRAKSELALQAAHQQLQGGLSKTISLFQAELTQQAAILEAWVDFPEEGLEFASFEQMHERITTSQMQIQKLLNTYHDGHKIDQGLKLCLLGRPNVGKSSLMNALLKKERSIVTEVAGTTRDVIEENATLCGLNVILSDTAGVRQSNERIEQEGIRRTWLKVQEADLVLWLLDASEGLTSEDKELEKLVPKSKSILVWNKCDLKPSLIQDIKMSTCQISAKHKDGLDELKDLISKTIWHQGPPKGDDIMLTSLRHKAALEEAVKSLGVVKQGLKDQLSAEFICSDMRSALQALASIKGTDVTEDIITAVFSTFCLGK